MRPACDQMSSLADDSELPGVVAVAVVEPELGQISADGGGGYGQQLDTARSASGGLRDPHLRRPQAGLIMRTDMDATSSVTRNLRGLSHDNR